MNKKAWIINIIQLCLWVLNTIALVTMILVDKDAELLNRLFVWFVVLLFVTPIVLSLLKLVILERTKPTSVDRHEWVPFIGLCANIALSFIFFVRSLNTAGTILTILLILGFFAAVYFLVKKLVLKTYVFKTHAISLGLSLVFYAALLIGLVFISFYFSVKW